MSAPSPEVTLGSPGVPVPRDVLLRPKLIGLAGKARSGKDTVASFLVEQFAVKTLAFARPLKDGLKTMLNLTDEHVHGNLKETVIPDFGKSPRQMLQTLGTDWGRSLVADDIWLLVAKRNIEQWLAEHQDGAITDVRFDNEAEMIRAMGGEVWHIERPAVGNGVVQAHASETGVTFDPYKDMHILNCGTLDDLRAKVIALF